jgi:CMP-N-acetylneuraminic acid synthetase
VTAADDRPLRVLGLITARGGSKGIPGKNIAPVAGKPLIAWTIEAALRSTSIARVIVTTDDPKIAQVAQQFGAEVPFLRPAELAADDSSSFDAVAHALRWLEENQGDRFDYCMLLQPTSPLRSAADIDGAIALARERQADAVLAVCEASPHPYLMRSVGEGGVLDDFIKLETKPSRRQEYPEAWTMNACIYLIRPAVLLATRSFQPPGALAYVMPRERSIDIDSPWDLRVADLLLTHDIA